jgi:hypothetical protein
MMPYDFTTPASRQARAINKQAKESSSDKSNKENEELSTNSMSRPLAKAVSVTLSPKGGLLACMLMSYPWLWTHILTLVTYGRTSPNTL